MGAMPATNIQSSAGEQHPECRSSRRCCILAAATASPGRALPGREKRMWGVEGGKGWERAPCTQRRPVTPSDAGDQHLEPGFGCPGDSATAGIIGFRGLHGCCDSCRERQAPCEYWGKGLSTDDHCHATDKEIRWTTLRQAFKCKHLPASHSEKQQNVVNPAMVPLRQQDIQCQVSAPQSDPSFLIGFSHFSLTNGSPLLDVAHQNQQRHILQGVLPNAGQTVGAPTASHLTSEGRDRDNGQTSRATCPHTPCGLEPYQQEDDEEYTSKEEDEEYTSEEEDEYTSEKAKVYVGNLHYGIVREDLDKLFGRAGFVLFSEAFALQLKIEPHNGAFGKRRLLFPFL